MMAQSKILFLLMALLIVNPFYGQSDQAKIDKATTLVNAYIDASSFKNGINTASIENFKKLFDPAAKIVFDIPFINTAIKNDDIKRISKDDRQQAAVINLYGKLVTVDMYLEILQREAEQFHPHALNFPVRLTERTDLSHIEGDTVIFEIEKQFGGNAWSIDDTVKYLVYVSIIKKEAQIISIFSNTENTFQNDVLIKLFDASLKSKDEKGYNISGVDAILRFKFIEPINNYSKQATTNASGLARFEKSANNSTVIYLDTVKSANGIRYDIPADWKEEGKEEGKKVSEQPPGGFIIGLRPYKWPGLAYSLFLSGGGFKPLEVNMKNFESGSSFESNIGYKIGINYNQTYFFNPDQWKINTVKWFFGLGVGLALDYQKATVTSGGFTQQKYPYLDSGSDTSNISFAGKAFSETNEMICISQPLFMELKKWIGEDFSFSIKAGMILSIPLNSTYKASGTFSRWGYYDDLNALPVTDDKFYNYFTDSLINFKGDFKTSTLLAEWFIKLNGYFNVFKKNPDNSLEVGLIFSMPFAGNTVYTYPEGQLQEFRGYWINTGNNEYSSVAYSNKKIFKYYFGLSVGLNLIRYKSR